MYDVLRRAEDYFLKGPFHQMICKYDSYLIMIAIARSQVNQNKVGIIAERGEEIRKVSFLRSDNERGLFLFFLFLVITLNQAVHGFQEEVPDEGVWFNGAKGVFQIHC